MRNADQIQTREPETGKKSRSFASSAFTAMVIAVNLLLISCVVALFVSYVGGYRDKLREQNLTNIKNVNLSVSNIASAFFTNQQKRLSDIVKYISRRNLSYSDTLSYIYDSNSDENSIFELIGTGSAGNAVYSVDGQFEIIKYTNRDYAKLRAIFEAAGENSVSGIMTTPEFTDACTGSQSFALYAYVKYQSGNDAGYCTLLEVSESADFAGLTDIDGGYAGTASILVNSEGDYIFGNTVFKSDNLFSYIYVYNGLTLDEKKALAEQFRSSDSGELYFDDSNGKPCVFVYSSVSGTEWKCVSCVPLSSFHSNSDDLKFSEGIAALLVALMVFNILWLNAINRRLKVSVQKEKEASAAKTDFLSRMSHDIRTPLNVIIGTTLLASKEANPPQTQRYLNNIDQSGNFLLALVNDILDLNKVESGKMELHLKACNLDRIMAGISPIISPLCEKKNITLSMRAAGGDKSFMADSVRIRQILYNLLSNSVKFTKEGGHIEIDCRAEETDGGMIELTLVESDDGEGMSEEFQKRMFEAFTQENRTAVPGMQGTGLGLAIVRNLTELMGGTISVKSAPGKGSLFTIKMKAAAAGAAGDEPKKPVDLSVLSAKRVLLFEDNPLNAEIASKLLESKGVTVECAENGKIGVEKIAASPEDRYDAVLMDLQMPVMDGITAAKTIREMKRTDAATVPIIAMTANAYDSDVQNCLDAGMNAHISKPIDPEVMYSTLAREISEKRK